MVQAPVMMDNDQKADYLAEHFWDAFFACGKTFEEQELEQAVSNHIALLSNLPLENAVKHVSAFAETLVTTEKADTSSSVFEDLSAIFTRYIFDPNSPLRDEDLYTPFARVMASCPLLDSLVRASYAEDVRLTSLNRRGTPAADFSFTDSGGHRHSLYGIKALRTILFFSNPGCTACKEIMEDLESVPEISDLIVQGTIAVLNIYIDEDLAGWREYMPIYPREWYNGYDDGHLVRDGELYNIRAIPSLYLLDENKRVLLKDATPEKLLNNL